MNLLAIETSSEYLSLALEAGGTLHDYHEHAGQLHAERILGEIMTLIAGAGLQKADLQGIAFGCGPGSFTGLRIACGVTQGLAYALDVRVKGIVTLMALAEDLFRTDGCRQVIACSDARMGEVYHAAYRLETVNGLDQWLEVSTPMVCKPEQVPDIAGYQPGEWAGCGTGFGVYGEALGQRHAGLRLVRAERVPTARAALALAKPFFTSGQADLPEQAQPIYIRDNVALKKGEQKTTFNPLPTLPTLPTVTTVTAA